MTKAFWELNKFDVETRIDDEGRPDPRKLLIAKDITDDGVVLQTGDVKVTAFRTPHPPIVDISPTSSDAGRHHRVLSDTAYNPKLAGSQRAPMCWCTNACTCPRSIASWPRQRMARR
jgi:hypothetical protein